MLSRFWACKICVGSQSNSFICEVKEKSLDSSLFSLDEQNIYGQWKNCAVYVEKNNVFIIFNIKELYDFYIPDSVWELDISLHGLKKFASHWAL